MASKRDRLIRTGATVARALKDAEKGLVRPPNGKTASVTLKPRDIETWPDLFQPRTFSYGLRELDQRYVEKLARRINTEGELDPPLVVKINNRWVCVDGHHRIAAYVSLKRSKGICCVWFAGTGREALDEALRENKKIKLEMSKEDKFEQAWHRTLMGGWSKKETVDATGVSEGMVALMRRIKVLYESRDKRGDGLRAKIRDIDNARWSNVRTAYLNLEPPAPWDAQEAAAKLARALNKRLTNKLSQNPDVTARALFMYDRDLPAPLVEALQRVIAERAKETQVEGDATRQAMDEEAYDLLNGR